MKTLSNYLVTTNKPHRCFACLRIFPAKTQMELSVNVNDGRIYSTYTCHTCMILTTAYSSMFLNEMENWFEEGCVNESLKKGQTPEQLLDELTILK